MLNVLDRFSVSPSGLICSDCSRTNSARGITGILLLGNAASFKRHGAGTRDAELIDVRFPMTMAAMLVATLLRVQAGETVAEFPFVFREGLLWIEVTVPQSEKPLNFLVDTGAGASVIDLAKAKRMGLRPGREIAVRGVATRLAGYSLQRVTATAGEVPLPDEYVGLDLEKLSGSCERPVDGLLGADFFRGRVVQIDFVGQRIRLLKSSPADGSGESLPLRLFPGGMRVAVDINEQKQQWVRLDTGCASSLQWVTSKVNPAMCVDKVAIGLAEISIPQTTTTVAIGKEVFEKVPTGLHEKVIFPGEAGLLGNGLLSRFAAITIDARTGRLLLEQRE
jgi:hypothetical protein